MSCNCKSSTKIEEPIKLEVLRVEPSNLSMPVVHKIIEAGTPIFQDSKFKYNDEAFQAYIKYDDMKPSSLDDLLKIFVEIEKKFVFKVYLQKPITTSQGAIHMTLGDLRTVYHVSSFRASLGEFSLTEWGLIFQTFKELLAAYVDLVGDKPSILRKTGDFEFYNKPLEEMGMNRVPTKTTITYSEYIGEVVGQRKIKESKDPSTNKILELADRVKIVDHKLEVKPKRKYELDLVDISDEVYNQVIEWIDSRKDFIHVEYNNMKEY